MEPPVIPVGMCPAISPYSFGAPGGVDRTDLEGGVGRYAMAWDRGTQVFNVTLMLTQDKFTVWNVFFLRVIKKGAITFQMDIDSGFGLEAHHCNILPGSYNAALTSGTVYAVTFQVEAEAASTYDLSDQDIANLIDMWNQSGGNLKKLLDRLAQFANGDTNVLNF